MRKQMATAARKPLAFGIALLAVMLATPGNADEMSVFGDWLASCDNVLTCTALALPLEEGGPTKTSDLLRFERPAGPDGFIDRVRMSFGENSIVDKDSLEFRVDGRTVLAVVHGALVQVKLPPDTLRSAAEAPIRTLYINRTGIALLIDAMAKGTILTITAHGGMDQRISLLGLVDALRWIDEQQGRVGTVTALVARGEIPASNVPNAPPLPVIRHATGSMPSLDDIETRRLLTVVRERLPTEEQPEECDGLNETRDPDSFAAFAFSVDRRLAVVAVPCRVSGAYNHVAALHGVDRVTAGSRPILIERNGVVISGVDEGLGVPVVVNVGFDQTNLRLSQYSAGRGVGDCGNYAEWVWNGERFALTLHRTMPVCRGADRGDWPVSYRVRVD